MSFEDFNFTNKCHCPHCKTGLLIIDNKIEFCPLCELMKRENTTELEKKTPIFQEIY